MPLTVKIFRGIQGAGKTTARHAYFARLAKNRAAPPGALHLLPLAVSADDHHMIDGVYRFDPLKIGEAHALCFRHYLSFLRGEAEGEHTLCDAHLVVDNTNIHAYEIAPYVQAANAYDVPSEIITVWCDPAVAWQRNVHDVPIERVFDMYRRLLKEELPPFWKQSILLPEERS